MTDSRFGEIVLVPFPFTDQTATKKRPAAVVSSEAYHREHPDLILMAITSRFRPSLKAGEAVVEKWQEAGLVKPSVLKPILFSMERSLVLRKLGRLSAPDLDALRNSLFTILGLSRARSGQAPP